MPHINDRYKLIQDKIEHKLREIATHQIIDINYEINTEWVEMISTSLYKVPNVSYLLYIRPYLHSKYDSVFQLIDIKEAEMDSAIVNVFRHLIIQFDKSEFRDLALDTCLN